MMLGSGERARMQDRLGPDLQAIERLVTAEPTLVAVADEETTEVGVWGRLPRSICLGRWGRLRALSRVAPGVPRLWWTTRPYLKLVTFVPAADLDKVRHALGEAGAGRTGRYACTAFWAGGQGSFLPLNGARPAVGRVGKLTVVDEYRLEALVPEWYQEAVEAALLDVHPYEEVARDWIRLENAVRLPKVWEAENEWWCAEMEPDIVNAAESAHPRCIRVERSGWSDELALRRNGIAVERTGPGGLLFEGLTRLWEEPDLPDFLLKP